MIIESGDLELLWHRNFDVKQILWNTKVNRKPLVKLIAAGSVFFLKATIMKWVTSNKSSLLLKIDLQNTNMTTKLKWKLVIKRQSKEAWVLDRQCLTKMEVQPL